ncbi:MAG TPA: hypothetical protein VH062_35095 [Polyangiaceae bacterium]|jgi:hypothetical protein|nr:hypothetical protein [Polyangiaceae bacterium]
MLDLFASAPRDLRRARLEEYGQYLVERDGELNIEERTLSRREATIARYETPPAAVRSMDEATFKKQYTAFDKDASHSPEILLLLALVKVNSAEAYGVSQNFQRTMNRALKNDDDAELRILCEEGYHTRMLLSASNRYGIEVTEPYRPPSALRVLIGGIATAPMAIARPLTLAGEIIGTLMFAKLLDVTRRVLGHDPETRDAIEERLVEICADERGHISYNRMHMGPAELAQTRLILPLTARIMATVFPEMVALGAFPLNVLQELPLITDPKRLPESVRRDSFVA